MEPRRLWRLVVCQRGLTSAICHMPYAVEQVCMCAPAPDIRSGAVPNRLACWCMRASAVNGEQMHWIDNWCSCTVE